MTFFADFYNGTSARSVSVEVTIETHSLKFEAEGLPYAYKLADIDLQAKLGRARRAIDLPDGGRLETHDVRELEAAMPTRTSAFWRSVHYLENHLGWVAFSLVATLFAGWLFMQYGVPKLAERVANATSPALETKIGEQVLQALDHKWGYFSASKTDPKRLQEIRAALSQLCGKTSNCPQYRLEFRQGGAIGANAFALPGGIMVMTDELIDLSKNNIELVAVLAHELGHVKGRHAFRQSLQGMLAGLILATVTGDMDSAASGIPAALMQLRYTRELETEADGFALSSMQKACLSPKAFADILQRLSAQSAEAESNQKHTQKPTSGGKSADSDHAIGDLFSTHPDTMLRIQPFLAAKADCHA